MKNATSPQRLLRELSYGKVYRRQDLAALSKSIDRDLKKLTGNGNLKKVGSGLYLYSENSRWGNLPADEKELASSFLKTSDLLLVSNSDFNSLGLGLTQLWNEVRVYNKRRHCKVKLGNTNFNFQVPFNGYPKRFTPEFLLVDLLNNIDSCGESPTDIKKKVSTSLHGFNAKLLEKLSEQHGKIATKKFFRQLLDR